MAEVLHGGAALPADEELEAELQVDDARHVGGGLHHHQPLQPGPGEGAGELRADRLGERGGGGGWQSGFGRTFVRRRVNN